MHSALMFPGMCIDLNGSGICTMKRDALRSAQTTANPSLACSGGPSPAARARAWRKLPGGGWCSVWWRGCTGVPFPFGVAELRAQACFLALHLRPLRLELQNQEIEVGRGLPQESLQMLHPLSVITGEGVNHRLCVGGGLGALLHVAHTV